MQLTKTIDQIFYIFLSFFIIGPAHDPFTSVMRSRQRSFLKSNAFLIMKCQRIPSRLGFIHHFNCIVRNTWVSVAFGFPFWLWWEEQVFNFFQSTNRRQISFDMFMKIEPSSTYLPAYTQTIWIKIMWVHIFHNLSSCIWIQNSINNNITQSFIYDIPVSIKSQHDKMTITMKIPDMRQRVWSIGRIPLSE